MVAQGEYLRASASSKTKKGLVFHHWGLAGLREYGFLFKLRFTIIVKVVSSSRGFSTIANTWKNTCQQ